MVGTGICVRKAAFVLSIQHGNEFWFFTEIHSLPGLLNLEKTYFEIVHMTVRLHCHPQNELMSVYNRLQRENF